MYKLSITVVESNPDYDPQEAAKLNRSSYSHESVDHSKANPSRERPALTVDLTDDEFKAIKKAVLECM
jgi:predicted DNA binding protein